MSAETRARELLERFDSGDRSRDLLEELDAVADEVADEDLRRSLVEAIYGFLYDEPRVFVDDSRAFFDEILATDGPLDPEPLTTFSVLAENPPEEFATHVNDLLILLTREQDLQRGLAARTLYHLAIDHPRRIDPAAHGLRSLLSDPNPRIRGTACLALGYLDATAARSAIADLRTDESVYVREAAAWTIARLEHDEATTADPVGEWSRAEFEQLTPREFERLVGDLWAAMGYRTAVSDPGPDEGIDVVATDGDERIAIQAKRYLEGPVSSPIARTVGGLTAREDVDRAVLVTSSSFTTPADSYADVASAVTLVDGPMLCELLELNDVDPAAYR